MTPKVFFEKGAYFLFFITLILLPVQFGKHFWPRVSFILGLKIDYLSPTVFLSDIFIALFIVVSLINYFFYKKKIRLEKLTLFLLSFFLLSIVFSALVNGGKTLFFLKTLKILEFALFALFVSFLDFKKIFYPAVFTLSFGILWTSLLATLQFGQQRSLGLWLLGERNFNISTPGISQLISANQLLLRPYSTFPHPNLLGAFLALFLPWTLFFLFKARKALVLTFFILTFSSGFVALFLSFSRTAWLVGFGSIFLIFAFFLWQRRKNFLASFRLQVFFGVVTFVALVSLFLFVGPLVWDRFLTIGTSDAHSLVLRTKFAKAAVSMFLSSPIFGLGPGNFIPNLPYFWQLQETIRILQPAHNLILLVLAELGIVGTFFLSSLFVRTFIQISRYRSKEKQITLLFLLTLFSVLFLSMFDHYFWTLQQGLFIFWLILGLSWSFSSPQPASGFADKRKELKR